MGCALLPLGLVLWAARRCRLRSRVPVFLTVTLLTFIPVDGLPVAGYIRGLTGDLSVTTLVLLSASGISGLTGRRLFAPRGFSTLMVLVLGAGLGLYPFALGLGPFDPYVLGFGSGVFVAVLLGVTVAAWYFERWLVAVSITAAVLAFSLGVLESRNLWDYLLDPLVWLFAVGHRASVLGFPRARSRQKGHVARVLDEDRGPARASEAAEGP